MINLIKFSKEDERPPKEYIWDNVGIYCHTPSNVKQKGWKDKHMFPVWMKHYVIRTSF